MTQKYYFDKMNAMVTAWAEAQDKSTDWQAELDKMYFLMGINPYAVMFPEGPQPGNHIYTMHSDYGDLTIVPTRYAGDDGIKLVREL